MIRQGERDQVRKELPDLLNRLPGDPGVLYIQGLLTEDGAEAVRLFQTLVDDHPKSEWSDDALFRIIQFYEAIGLYRTAELKTQQLAEQYPQSEYLSRLDSPPVAVRTDEESTVPDPLRGDREATENNQGQFGLQVGAYSSQENAEKQKLFFEDQGYPVDVINRVRESRSLFLVIVGNYQTYDDAKIGGAEIRRLYSVDSFVVSR
jgi:hypothetical protein